MLQGKLNTEDLLHSRGLNWTSVRPVYIYGPLNYNPVEEWFFQRLAEGRPIPIPNSGQQVGAARHASPTHAAGCALRMHCMRRMVCRAHSCMGLECELRSQCEYCCRW